MGAIAFAAASHYSSSQFPPAKGSTPRQDPQQKDGPVKTRTPKPEWSIANHWLLLAALGVGLGACGANAAATDDVVTPDAFDPGDVDLDGVDEDALAQLDVDIKSDTVGGKDSDAGGADGGDASDGGGKDSDGGGGGDTKDAGDAVTPPGGCTSTAECGDKNACTLDTCTPEGKCIHSDNLNMPCNDGSVCTNLDLCGSAGSCAGTAISCDDGKPCTTDACDKVSGCSHTANTASCDDGIACTTGDVCSGGSCVGMPSTASCTDANACTDDACDVSKKQCVHLYNTVTCTDGNLCNEPGTCGDGACKQSPVVCNDNNSCTADACNPATGACVFTSLGGSACDDGNVCTTGDVCDFNLCKGPTPTDCDDGNVCTLDSCVPTVSDGCVHKKASETPCSDASVCTVGDMCSDGTCLAGEVTLCSDDNACTDDACSATSGCTFLANDQTPCSDGDLCTTDTCKDGACLSTAVVCPSDVTSCSFGYCDASDGSCQTSSAVWKGRFSGGAKGWSSEGEWQIGLAVASTGETFGFGDPATDYDGDGFLAGTVIGGDISNTPHGYVYLTSPAIDLSAFATDTYASGSESLLLNFRFIDNLSGAAGQVATVQFSPEGVNWYPGADANLESAMAAWASAYSFFGSKDALIPEMFLTAKFRFRIGFKVDVNSGAVPTVSGLSVDAPEVWLGKCTD